MKITSIDPISIREEREKTGGLKSKPQVKPLSESTLEPALRDALEHKVVDIIEEAQKRAKKKQRDRDSRKKSGLSTYTKVGFGQAALQEKGKKLDTKV